MTFLDDELSRSLSPELAVLGLELVRPRRWVSSTTLPIRRMFWFYPLKGMRYTACWGFSLDFVPHIKARHLRWKRTSKTAAFDLCIDPVDEEGVADWCSLSFYPPLAVPSRQEIAQVASATSRRARHDYARVASINDIVALFEERSKMTFQRFSLENYVQTEIAWGLALIALGRSEEGETHIAAYCEHFRVDRDDPVLSKARLAAAAYHTAEPNSTLSRS
jgi:hypothetical protein